MSYTATRLLEIACNEIGYKEKETNSHLDSPLANAGDGNWTKYARDLHTAGYYQSAKNGYAWCDMFVDWCFWKLAGSKEKGEWLECQTGLYGAGCKWSSKCYRNAGRFDQTPKPGSQIFFGKIGEEEHTGIVERIENGKVYTIEGNASNMVKRCAYPLNSSKIVGYGHPRFDSDDNREGNGDHSNATTPKFEFKTGDIINFNGTTHYSSANADRGSKTKAGLAKITSVHESGKHPYHCRAINASGSYVSGVYGWVDAEDVTRFAGQDDEQWTPSVGDIVNYIGDKHYANSNASNGAPCKGGKAKITNIYRLGYSKHPYHLVRVAGKGSTVCGWVDVGTFTKA